MTRSVEELLASVHELAHADARARLAFIEEAASATEAATDLGDDGAQAALHLRAALGAFVRFGQLDPETRRTPRALAELDVVVRTLLGRATLALYRALAHRYDELVRARAPQRMDCVALRDAFREAARAVERGEAVPERTRALLRTARATADGAR